MDDEGVESSCVENQRSHISFQQLHSSSCCFCFLSLSPKFQTLILLCGLFLVTNDTIFLTSFMLSLCCSFVLAALPAADMVSHRNNPKTLISPSKTPSTPKTLASLLLRFRTLQSFGLSCMDFPPSSLRKQWQHLWRNTLDKDPFLM
ncbi:hypothetical protein TB2_014695 [Malus domestica]